MFFLANWNRRYQPLNPEMPVCSESVRVSQAERLQTNCLFLGERFPTIFKAVKEPLQLRRSADKPPEIMTEIKQVHVQESRPMYTKLPSQLRVHLLTNMPQNGHLRPLRIPLFHHLVLARLVPRRGEFSLPDPQQRISFGICSKPGRGTNPAARLRRGGADRETD
jgi:hypothetical protein